MHDCAHHTLFVNKIAFNILHHLLLVWIETYESFKFNSLNNFFKLNHEISTYLKNL
jgi:hypothetical protein